MFNCKKAVFIGAHTDDEMICAGTLHRLVQQGVEVHVITCSPAATIDDRKGHNESSAIVQPEWATAMDLIGIENKNRAYLGLCPSVDLELFRQWICQTVYNYCEQHKPDLAITLSPEDENTAHSLVGTECERVFRGRVATNLRCHFPWNYGLGRPNLYIKLSKEDLEIKREVIRAYKSQLFRYQYLEMLTSYAIADGLSVKVQAAERFEIVRSVL